MLEIGGKRWQKYGKDRIYFSGNVQENLIGLELDFYKSSGRISYSALKGEKISHGFATKIHNELHNNKLYVDIAPGEIKWTDLYGDLCTNDEVKDIIQNILDACEEVEAVEENEEVAKMAITRENWEKLDYDRDGIKIDVRDADEVYVETKDDDRKFQSLDDAIEFANEKLAEMNRVMTMDNGGNEMEQIITKENFELFDVEHHGLKICVLFDDDITVETGNDSISVKSLDEAIEIANKILYEKYPVMTMDNWDEFTVEENGVCVYIDDDGAIWVEDAQESNQEESLDEAIATCNRALDEWRSGR